MDANLLIVSSEEFPHPLFKLLEKSGFTCFYSRGVIKTKEILKKHHIDAIVWFFLGRDSALAKDLSNVFNQFDKLPIVLITQNYEQLDFAEAIKDLYANLDLNDELDDIVDTIETACNQSIIKEQQPEATNTHEIEFKNAVSQMIGKMQAAGGKKKSERKNRLQQLELWEAVDKKEKQILAGRMTDKERKALLPKIKTWIKKP